MLAVAEHSMTVHEPSEIGRGDEIGGQITGNGRLDLALAFSELGQDEGHPEATVNRLFALAGETNATLRRQPLEMLHVGLRARRP